MVQLKLAGVESTLPAVSVARTSNVRVPTLRLLYGFGEEHEQNEPPSSQHSNVEPVSEPLK